MNPYPSETAAQSSTPAANEPATEKPLTPPNATPRGINSSLKLAIPIIAMVGVIFGITFFSQYSPNSGEDGNDGKDGGGVDPPLRFFSATRVWDPPALLALNFRGFPLLAWSADRAKDETPWKFSVQDRIFPGFYEIQSDAVGPKNTASFWFENPHDKSVTMKQTFVSCGQCSGGRLAAIPPDVTRQILQMSRVSILPQGFVSGMPIGMVGPAANLHPDRLNWTQHSFLDNPNVVYKVPAADNPDGWSPQWGILELQFSIAAIGPKGLRTDFAATVDGTQQGEINVFNIGGEGVPPFALSTTEIDVGLITENSEAKHAEIIAYSSTRGPHRSGPNEKGDLAAPNVMVRMPPSNPGEPGQFVKVSAPVRVPEAELAMIADSISLIKSNRQKPVKVESAFRYTVTVLPKIGGTRIDMGMLERSIGFSLPGTEEQYVNLRGMVSGVVWLDDNQHEITMPRFGVTEGFSKQFKLITARKDMEVNLVGELTKPRYLEVKFEKDPKPASSDRGYYNLRITVPSNKQDRTVGAGTWPGEVVLEVKGTSQQRIRIPVKLSIGAY